MRENEPDDNQIVAIGLQQLNGLGGQSAVSPDVLYRANVATPLGVSPHYALFGRPMTVGIDTMLLTDMETSPDIQRYTAELIPRLKIVQDAVRENLKDSNVSSKQVYGRKSKEPNFELGSKVLLHDPTTKKGECPKLKQRWKGP